MPGQKARPPHISLSLSVRCSLSPHCALSVFHIWLNYCLAVSFFGRCFYLCYKKETRFALHSFQVLAKIFHISFSWMCELLFRFDELSDANKGHIRISRCACVNRREHIWRKKRDSIQKAMCYDSVILNSSVKVCVFKWLVRETRICCWRSFSQTLVYPLCLQHTRKGHWHKKGKTLEPALSGVFSLSHPNIPAALEGCNRQQTSEQATEREA